MVDCDEAWFGVVSDVPVLEWITFIDGWTEIHEYLGNANLFKNNQI